MHKAIFAHVFINLGIVGWNVPVSKNKKETKQMVKQKTDRECVNVLTTVRIEREADRQLKPAVKKLDISQSVFIRYAGAEGNPETEHQWYDRVKESVEYIGRNWGPLVFILDRLCGK